MEIQIRILQNDHQARHGGLKFELEGRGGEGRGRRVLSRALTRKKAAKY